LSKVCIITANVMLPVYTLYLHMA